MKLKAKRKIIGFNGATINEGDIFKIDDTNYNLKNFYKNRLADGDVEEVVKEIAQEETAIINNKKKVVKNEDNN